MKKSEMITKMQTAYAIRHVMVEGGYITIRQFMEELLHHMQSHGMLPPRTKLSHINGEDNCWDPEESQNDTKEK